MNINFTRDELRLIQFLIENRNNPESYNLYPIFMETLQETHVGCKVLDALIRLDAKGETSE